MSISTKTDVFNDRVLADILESLNKHMLAEAEPILQAALKDIEERMRKEMVANLIAMLQTDFDIYRQGHVLTIGIRNLPAKGQG